MTGRTLIAAATAAFAAFAAPGSKAEEVPLRGIVEGYYGRPWGTGGRESILAGAIKSQTTPSATGPFLV